MVRTKEHQERLNKQRYKKGDCREYLYGSSLQDRLEQEYGLLPPRSDDASAPNPPGTSQPNTTTLQDTLDTCFGHVVAVASDRSVRVGPGDAAEYMERMKVLITDIAEPVAHLLAGATATFGRKLSESIPASGSHTAGGGDGTHDHFLAASELCHFMVETCGKWGALRGACDFQKLLRQASDHLDALLVIVGR